MVEYLATGMQALGQMPTRSVIVMERFFDEVGDMHVVIHSPFGSRINRGWGLALRKRFCKSFNFELQAAANEDSIVISLGSIHSFPLDDVFKYLQSATVRDVLVQALLDAPMFEVVGAGMQLVLLPFSEIETASECLLNFSAWMLRT